MPLDRIVSILGFFSARSIVRKHSFGIKMPIVSPQNRGKKNAFAQPCGGMEVVNDSKIVTTQSRGIESSK